MSRKGFAWSLIVVLVAGSLGAGGYALYLQGNDAGSEESTGGALNDEFGTLPDTSGPGAAKTSFLSSGEEPPAIETPKEETPTATVKAGWTTYKNNQYGFQVSYPSEIVFDQNVLVQCEDTSTPVFTVVKTYVLNAGTPQKYLFYTSSSQNTSTARVYGGGVKAALEEGCFFRSDSLMRIAVFEKSPSFESLSVYVQEMQKQETEASKNSAAGAAISVNEVRVGDLQGYQLTTRGLSVAENTSVTTYFEGDKYIYAMTYDYSRAYAEENSDEKLILELAREIIETFQILP